jgi:hypothetical protein
MTVSRQQLATALGLLVVLTTTYLITFRGIFFSSDEILLFDMTESVARRGNFDETLTYSLSPQRNNDPNNLFTSLESYEPLQPLLAAPLFVLFQSLPDMNMMHGVWLLNVLVVPLTALVFFWGVRMLGYGRGVALTGALLLGLGTLLFPYSRTFFREPLMTLFVTGILMLALRIQRSKGRFPWREWGGVAGLFVLAIFTKEVSVLFLPAVALLTLGRRWQERVLLGLGMALLLGVLVVMEQLGVAGGNRFAPSRWVTFITDTEWRWVSESFRGYSYSPGRSVFLFSPILLLTPWGMWRLWQRGEWRLVLSMVGTFLLFAVGYGVLREGFWSGGISLGPRYLLPLIPLLMLAIMPLLDDVARHPQKTVQRVIVGGVAMLSIITQLLFVSYTERDYYDTLNRAGVLGYEAGIWTVEYAPHSQFLQNMRLDALPVVWRHSALWPLIIGVLVVIVVSELRRLYQGTTTHVGRSAAALAVLPLVVMIALYSVDDPRFVGDYPATPAAIEQLEDLARIEDAIILKDDSLLVPFAATFSRPALVATLPPAPGEIYSPTHVPLIAGGPPIALAGRPITTLYDYLAPRHDRLWLVTYFGPFHDFARRPEERLLAERYFPFTRIEISENMYIVGVNTAIVTDETPPLPTAIDFGEVLGLQGYTLPDGDTYTGGDVIPAALDLNVLSSVERDYTLALQLSNEARQVVAQYDAFPVGGFGRTSAWQVGETYREKRGILLPDDLPPGQYRLQMIVYFWETLDRLPVTDASGASEPDVAVLQSIIIR